jgi:hypothetical protein
MSKIFAFVFVFAAFFLGCSADGAIGTHCYVSMPDGDSFCQEIAGEFTREICLSITTGDGGKVVDSCPK